MQGAWIQQRSKRHWACDSCGEWRNFANKLCCFKCGAKAPKWQQERAANRAAVGGAWLKGLKDKEQERARIENAKLRDELARAREANGKLRKQVHSLEPETPAMERGARIVELRDLIKEARGIRQSEHVQRAIEEYQEELDQLELQRDEAKPAIIQHKSIEARIKEAETEADKAAQEADRAWEAHREATQKEKKLRAEIEELQQRKAEVLIEALPADMPDDPAMCAATAGKLAVALQKCVDPSSPEGAHFVAFMEAFRQRAAIEAKGPAGAGADGGAAKPGGGPAAGKPAAGPGAGQGAAAGARGPAARKRPLAAGAGQASGQPVKEEAPAAPIIEVDSMGDDMVKELDTALDGILGDGVIDEETRVAKMRQLAENINGLVSKSARFQPYGK